MKEDRGAIFLFYCIASAGKNHQLCWWNKKALASGKRNGKKNSPMV